MVPRASFLTPLATAFTDTVPTTSSQSRRADVVYIKFISMFGDDWESAASNALVLQAWKLLDEAGETDDQTAAGLLKERADGILATAEEQRLPRGRSDVHATDLAALIARRRSRHKREWEEDLFKPLNELLGVNASSSKQLMHYLLQQLQPEKTPPTVEACSLSLSRAQRVVSARIAAEDAFLKAATRAGQLATGAVSGIIVNAPTRLSRMREADEVVAHASQIPAVLPN
jgi:hypothetical protein